MMSLVSSLCLEETSMILMGITSMRKAMISMKDITKVLNTYRVRRTQRSTTESTKSSIMRKIKFTRHSTKVMSAGKVRGKVSKKEKTSTILRTTFLNLQGATTAMKPRK